MFAYSFKATTKVPVALKKRAQSNCKCFSIALVIFPRWNIQSKDIETSLLIKDETTLTKKKKHFCLWCLQYALVANL